MDDAPDRQVAGAFEGFDNGSDPTRLPASMCAEGLNMHCKGDGYVETRPGLRLVCNFLSVLSSSPTDPFYTTTGAPNRYDQVKSLGYYDQLTEEYGMVIWNQYVWSIGSASNGVTPNWRVNGLQSSPVSPMVQLVDRMFYLKDGALLWSKITGGVHTTGTVTQFSDASAMPVWTNLVVQNFRLLAYDGDGNKLYTSAVGTAHNAADWVKTDNIRVGEGDGDPARSLNANQGGFVTMLNGRSVWQIDVTDAAVANWSSLRVTKLLGCVEGKTAVTIGQDVYFLSRYGVVNLGALSDTISISPSSTLSAPLQPYIDRINWNAIGTAFATTWGEYYLIALPLDSNSYPKHIFPFHLRTRRWQAPWVYNLPTNNATNPNGVAIAYSGFASACVCNFGDKAETLLGDTAGRIFRIDDTVTYDEGLSGAQTLYESWVVPRRFDHGGNQQHKQPLYAELVFQGSTGVDTKAALLVDGAAALTTAGGFVAANQVGTMFTGAGGLEKKRFLARQLSRYREAALQIWAVSGKLKLREAALSAFMDPPFYT